MNFVSRFRHLVTETVSRWLDDYAPSMGAALAYYTLFSLAPLLVIVIALAGFVFGHDAVEGQIVLELKDLIGPQGAATIEALVKSASDPKVGTVAIVIGVATLLIGATSVFSELQSDLDRIWRAPPHPNEGWLGLVRQRLGAFSMVMGIGFLLLTSLVISAALAALGTWWSAWFGNAALLLQVANFVVSFALTTLLFAMIYKILPRVAIEWRDVWVGSAVTALLFTLGKVAIGLYLGKSGVANAYGAAGSVVILLIWVYYAAQIFLLGAEFTHVYAQTRGSLAPRAPSSQPAAPPTSPA